MKKIIAPTQTYHHVITDQTIDSDTLTPFSHYINCQIDCSATFEGCEEIRFENCHFSTTELTKCEFLDVHFLNCNLANTDFEEAVFFRVLFEGCKLLGTNFINTYAKDVRWLNNSLSYANFSEAKFVKCQFDTCDMTESFFQDTTFETVAFTNNRLTGTDFSQTVMKGIDLSSCEFHHIVVSPELLRGLKIAPVQASAIVHHFGVILTE